MKRYAEQMKRSLSQLLDDQGVSVVEIILILVVLIALVVIFKTQLTSLVNSIFEKITSESAGSATAPVPGQILLCDSRLPQRCGTFPEGPDHTRRKPIPTRVPLFLSHYSWQSALPHFPAGRRSK